MLCRCFLSGVQVCDGASDLITQLDKRKSPSHISDIPTHDSARKIVMGLFSRLFQLKRGGRGLALKYDDGEGGDSDVQEDEGVLCCQGDSIPLQKKLINWLCVSWLADSAGVRVCAAHSSHYEILMKHQGMTATTD